MSTTDVRSDASGIASVKTVDMKLEVVIIPVSDVDRAKKFYARLGWRLDITPPSVVQRGFRTSQMPWSWRAGTRGAGSG